MEIGKDELKLLELITIDLLDEIEKNEDALHVKQKSFQFLTSKNEEIQIQITVTRDESEFLDDFQTEIMRGY